MALPHGRDAFTSPTQPGTLEILSQEIDEDRLDGMYRIRIGDGVRYLTVRSGVYDDIETMYMPRLFLPSLPPLPPPDAWTTMEMFRSTENNARGQVRSTTSAEPLPCAGPAWHENLVDVLSLTRVVSFGARTKEVLYDGRPAVAKIARFPWEIDYVRRETMVYQDIHDAYDEQQEKGDGGDPFTPPFLGHLTENGRVMGLLLGKVEGAFAGIDDLPACAAALKRLHAMGIVHGDVNRYNFIVGAGEGDEKAGEVPHPKSVWMFDLEHAENFSVESSQQELDSLAAALTEETGRGAKGVVIEADGR